MRTFYRTVIMLLTLSAVQTAWADGNNWMASLPDNVYITQLSIPGTHDAATSTCSGVSKTQTYTISQQWEKGVRVFDLRPTDENDDGPIYHGSGIFRSSTGTTLKAELGNLKTKLAANSTEFAIVIIRNENNTGQDNGKWKEVIKPILDAYNDVLTEWNPDLRLGDVRGKILVFARDEVTETKAAKVWDWGDNQTYKGDILTTVLSTSSCRTTTTTSTPRRRRTPSVPCWTSRPPSTAPTACISIMRRALHL